MSFLQRLLLPLLVAANLVAADEHVLFPEIVHLGVAGFPEWEEYATSRPRGRDLSVPFQSTGNATASTLLLTQEGVKHGWKVLLNGRPLGRLIGNDKRLTARFEIAPGGLRKGENRLDIRAPKQVDDIRIGNLRLLPAAFDQLVARSGVEVRVTDADNDAPLPCRLTIVGSDGALAALNATGSPADEPVAVRPGVIYTRNGQARIGLLPGDYTVYASRGFEYAVATNQVRLEPDTTRSVRLQIRREVPTPGWVAADTHIHTLALSGHGDATLEERMLTIAGEGIEVAVATEHNHHGDYATPARRLKTDAFFTAVTGNEVTTKHGHFNAFPILAGAPVPDFKTTNWTQLLRGIRSTPGVQVIQLNHPHNVHSGFSPFSAGHLNPVSGRPAPALDFGFDALEVLTSAAMQSDIMRLFHDWFALLNHGHRLTGLGTSDTHDVDRFILGQGRTYVRVEDHDPARIDMDAFCRSLRAGHCLISFGLLAEMRINGRGPGETATPKDGTLEVTVRVSGPGWIHADRLELFANGKRIADRRLHPTSAIVKTEQQFQLRPLPNDTFLVAIATGPGVTAPFWDTPRPYQPTSKQFVPRMLGATNPVFVDADGDGEFTPAREYAGRLLRRHQDDAVLLSGLSEFDEAVAIQVADQLLQTGRSTAARLKLLLGKTNPTVRDAVTRYLDSL